jgi:hypothetical protein
MLAFVRGRPTNVARWLEYLVLRQLVGRRREPAWRASERKLRLFGCGCCRRHWPMMDSQLRQAVEEVERYADGFDTGEAIATLERTIRHGMAGSEAEPDASAVWRVDALLAWHAIAPERTIWAEDVLLTGLSWLARGIPGEGRAAWRAEAHRHCSVLRCVFGNPFRVSSPLPPGVLAWNDGTARRIAEGIYEERQMPEGTLDSFRLAILADALLDAGCDDEELLAHCRSAGPHVRGCWAVDLVLAKR